MSIRNPNQLALSLPFPERGRVVVDGVIGVNGRREGPRQASEGLGNEPSYRNAFGQGAVFSRDGSSHESFDAVIADGRGVYGQSNPPPSWAAVDQATRSGFWQGTDGTEQSVTPRPPVYSPRDGANYNTLAPIALNPGERPGTTYAKTFAPPQGGRDRHNEADCTDI